MPAPWSFQFILEAEGDIQHHWVRVENFDILHVDEPDHNDLDDGD